MHNKLEYSITATTKKAAFTVNKVELESLSNKTNK
jgi:hypothetical protein